MKTKKFFGAIAIAATSALVLSGTATSYAAPKPASKATVGADCTVLSYGLGWDCLKQQKRCGYGLWYWLAVLGNNQFKLSIPIPPIICRKFIFKPTGQ